MHFWRKGLDLWFKRIAAFCARLRKVNEHSMIYTQSLHVVLELPVLGRSQLLSYGLQLDNDPHRVRLDKQVQIFLADVVIFVGEFDYLLRVEPNTALTQPYFHRLLIDIFGMT